MRVYYTTHNAISNTVTGSTSGTISPWKQARSTDMISWSATRPIWLHKCSTQRPIPRFPGKRCTSLFSSGLIEILDLHKNNAISGDKIESDDFTSSSSQSEITWQCKIVPSNHCGELSSLTLPGLYIERRESSPKWLNRWMTPGISNMSCTSKLYEACDKVKLRETSKTVKDKGLKRSDLFIFNQYKEPNTHSCV